MAICPQCGDTDARPGGFCPGCGGSVPAAEADLKLAAPDWELDALEMDSGGPEPSAVAGLDPHVALELTAQYQYASVPAGEAPLVGVLVDFFAHGEPIVPLDKEAVAHVILALDLSASMRHPEKYPVLRAAVKAMIDDLHAPDSPNVLVSIVVFSKRARVIFRGVPSRALEPRAVFRAMERSPQIFKRYTDIPGALSHAGRIAYDQARADRLLPIRIYLMTDGIAQDTAGALAMADKLARIPVDLHALAFGEDADVAHLQQLFAGKRGGTVKSVRKETIRNAFERIAVVAKRVVSTRCLVDVNLGPGAVGGDAFRYRPARVRYPKPAFRGGKAFSADLGVIETGRTYQLLFELRPPEGEEGVSHLGEVTVRIPSFGGPVTRTLRLELPRTAPGSPPGAEDERVRTALDILGALSNADPRKALRALRLRRRIYEHEKRDPGLLSILDKAILLLETTGSLDELSPDDHATLLAHTATSGGESEELF